MSEQAETKSRTRIKYPSMYSIIIHNDDKTPMDYVTGLLIEVFNLNQDQAIRIMLDIHMLPLTIAEGDISFSSTGVKIASYTKEIADQKYLEAIHFCTAREIPLKVEKERIG